jgi:hypothetical protein
MWHHFRRHTHLLHVYTHALLSLGLEIRDIPFRGYKIPTASKYCCHSCGGLEQCFSTFLSPRTSKMSENILRTTKL